MTLAGHVQQSGQPPKTTDQGAHAPHSPEAQRVCFDERFETKRMIREIGYVACHRRRRGYQRRRRFRRRHFCRRRAAGPIMLGGDHLEIRCGVPKVVPEIAFR